MRCRLRTALQPIAGRSNHHINSFLPFLYETRTILRSFHTTPCSQNAPQSSFKASPAPSTPFRHASYRSRVSAEENELPLPAPPDYNEQDEPATHEQSSPRTASMTKAERDTFARLFNSLRPRQPAQQGRTASGGKKKPRHRVSFADEDADEFTLDSAAADRELDALSAQNTEDAASVGDAAVNADVDAYPEAIRGMAAKARLEVARERRRSEAARVAAERGEGSVDERVEGFDREKSRVFEAIDAAETDVQVWEVLEREVFAVVKRLDLDGLERKKREDVAAAEVTAAKRKRQTRRKKDTELDAEVSIESRETQQHHHDDNANLSSAASPQTTPSDLHLLAHIYAPILHHALHRLTTYTIETPLALTLLPHIKSLGPSSYTLGASVSFYNTLLTHLWRVHADLAGMAFLLREMTNAGLAPNRRTAEILGEVLAVDAKAARGELGTAMAAAREMVGWREGVRDVAEWRRTVLERWEKAVVERSRRVEAVRRLRAEGVFDEEGEALDEDVGAEERQRA